MGIIDIIGLIVGIYLFAQIVELKKHVKKLTSQLDSFKEDYRYLIKIGAIKLPDQLTQTTETQSDATVKSDVITKSHLITDPIAIQSDRFDIPDTEDEINTEATTEHKTPVSPVIKQIPVEPAGPSYLDNFIEWFKVDWPMKIGGLVFILGVGWFLIFAIQNNWISPAMRIAIGIIVSICMIGFGRSKLKDQPIQGSYLVGLGSAVYVLSIFIGYKFFGFFGIGLGLGLIGAQYALMAYLSYHYRNHWLNDVGLFFSMICPFIFSDRGGNYLGLFSYLTIHIVGNMVVSYRYNWDKSRLVGLVYVCVYILLGLGASSIVLGTGPLIAIILLLLMSISLLEIWLGRNSASGFSSTQLATIALAGVSIISYVTILRFDPSNAMDQAIYGGICLYFAVGYLTLWYLYSNHNPQNSYSGIVGIMSILFISAIAYDQLSGVSLLLTSILITTAIISLATIVTKDEVVVRGLSMGWVVSGSILLYQYSTNGVSDGYLIALYSFVVIGGALAWLYRQYLPGATSLRNTTIAFGIAAFYLAICQSFDGTTRIVILEVISLIIALVGSHLHLSKSFYLQAGVASILLPALYILGHGLYQDIILFGLMIGLVMIVGVYCWMQQSIQEDDQSSLSYQALVIVGLVLLYLAGPYLIQSEYYTLAYTILGMMIYLVGTKHRNPLKLSQLGYSYVLIIPILLSVSLLDHANTSMVVLTTILLSASVLWIIQDNRKDEYMNGTVLYAYVLASLVYFWWFGYVATRTISSSESAIVVMLIVFTIIGIICYVRGKSNDSKDLRTIGTVIIIAMIARVLVVELWLMDLIEKIITCLVIGGLLVASGFIGNKKTHGDDHHTSDNDDQGGDALTEM